MSGHTPGPWYAKTCRGPHNQGLIISDAGENIAVAYDNKDAAILAAAPDMLEALRELVKWMDDSGLSATSPGGVGPLHYGTTEYSVVTAARDAIAKAEGR